MAQASTKTLAVSSSLHAPFSNRGTFDHFEDKVFDNEPNKNNHEEPSEYAGYF